MNKKQVKRVTVDYAHIEEIKTLPCVQPWMSAEQFGKVYANKRLTAEEGGEE